MGHKTKKNSLNLSFRTLKVEESASKSGLVRGFCRFLARKPTVAIEFL